MAEEKTERIMSKILWGFQFGDELLRLLVKAETTIPQPITVVAVLDEGVLVVEHKSGYQEKLASAQGLLLTKRQGFPYKLRDDVKALKGPAKGYYGKVVLINPYNNEMLVDFKGFGKGHKGENERNQPWFPPDLNLSANSCVWCTMEHFTVSSDAGARIFVPKGELKNFEPAAEALYPKPDWLKKFYEKKQAGLGHVFVLWGNINDWQRGQDGNYQSLIGYLQQIFEQRDLFMIYCLSAGLKFGQPEMEKLFRQRYCQIVKEAPPKGTAGLAGDMQASLNEAPLDKVIGQMPEEVFPFLEEALSERTLSDFPVLSKVLLITFARNIFSANAASNNQSRVDKINVETILRWAKDARMRESGVVIFIMVSQLADLDQSLLDGHSGIVPIHINKPKDRDRTGRWNYLRRMAGAEFDSGMDQEALGRITNGLSLRQLDELHAVAKFRGEAISLKRIRERKQELLQEEFGGLLKVVRSDFGLEYFGGRPELIEYLRRLQFNVMKGLWRRVPVGIFAPGPPGTGKTTLWKCYAHDTGMNCVELGDLRQQWLGTSERDTELVLTAIDDMSPAVVVEDESDQSEGSRDSPNGDSGVSSRLRQKKLTFCSDPRRRGRVIWVRISNRADLIDFAYLRKGRTDEVTPFVLPSEEDMVDIFRVKFMEYGIPTDIVNFAPFAKRAKSRIYVTGADIDWMVREADILSGNAGKERVEAELLFQAIDDWEMQTNPLEIDFQIILALKGSSIRLRPAGWERMLEEARGRLDTKLSELAGKFKGAVSSGGIDVVQREKYKRILN